MDLERLCENLDNDYYDGEYIGGCTKFKDYTSFEEYVKDVIICISSIFPHYNIDDSKNIAKVNMNNIEYSFGVKENAYDCAIDLGFACG